MPLGAHNLVDLLGHQLAQHPEPDTNAQRQQPSFAAPASSPSAAATRGVSSSIVVATCATGTVSFNGSSSFELSGIAANVPAGADAAGATAVKFYELRDNLRSGGRAG